MILRATTRLMATEDSAEVKSGAETSIFALPPGHNMDDGFLETGLDADPEAKPLLTAAQRLR